jgi:hypothetical protein
VHFGVFLRTGEVLHALSLNASIQMKNARKSQAAGGGASPRVTFSNGLDHLTPRSASGGGGSGSGGEVHVPHLNSKLTHMLKDTMGGNCRTIMIACIGTENDQYHHTLQTLGYGSRAMKVRNSPRMNRYFLNVTENQLKKQLALANERDIIK